MRLSVAGSLEVPELADLIFETGVIDARRRLATWLAEADRLGLLKVENPLQAAELFAGMAIGGLQMRVLVQAPLADDLADVPARAQRTAMLFCRAFAVEPASRADALA
jgi:hypothetical protein